MIEIRDLRKMYQTGNTVVRALDGVTTRIGDGEIVAVIGKSGSGKTTLLHALGGMDVPAGGEIVVEGKRISRLPSQKDRFCVSVFSSHSGFDREGESDASSAH